MKTFFNTLSALAMVLVSFSASATVYRVNNQPGVDADYTTIASAITAAATGDTLYVESSVLTYGVMTLNKPLVILGAGYFIAANDSTQALPNSSRFDRIVVQAAGSGSVIAGIEVRNTDSNSSTNPFAMVDVQTNANNVSLIRCYFFHAAQGNSTNASGAALNINNSASNTLVTQCFIEQDADRSDGSCSGCCLNSYAVNIGSNCSGLVFSNNIIKFGNKNASYASSCTQRAFQMATSSSAIIVNNVFMGPIHAYNSVFANNIQISGTTSAGSSFINNGSFPNVIQNNIGHLDQFGTANGNQSNVNMVDVFVYGPGNERTDNHYILAAGSPAIAAGVGGIDCGAFGGEGAFKLSGLPGIPAIFQAVVPFQGNTTDGLNITLDAKSHQ